jgi:hypothetical protein
MLERLGPSFRLFRHAFEWQVIVLFFEQRQPGHGPIVDMKPSAGRANAGSTGHSEILTPSIRQAQNCVPFVTAERMLGSCPTPTPRGIGAMLS